jgi:hypothetical protein
LVQSRNCTNGPFGTSELVCMLRAVMPTVLIRLDEAGPWPVLVDDDEDLMTEPGVRWRFVADVPDHDTGLELLEQLHRQREAGQLERPLAGRLPAATE